MAEKAVVPLLLERERKRKGGPIGPGAVRESKPRSRHWSDQQ